MMFPDYRRVDDQAAIRRFESLWNTALDPEPGLTVVEIMHAATRGEIRGMYVMGENPAMSDPDLHHARAAMASLDLLVVQDIFPTETAWLADVILPASAFPEKAGSFTNTDRMVQLARPALRPPGEARQDLWIIGQIARRLGLDWHYEQARHVFTEMREGMDSIAGISWERLEREGSVTYPCANADDPGQPVVFVDRFPTATGKARLVPAGLVPGDEPPDREYPFVLITGRPLEHWHTGAMTRRAYVLDATEPEATVAMHGADLARLGVAPGDEVQVASRRGRIRLKVRADDGVARGSVFIPFAYAEAAANLLTNPVLDPFGKIPEFKYCAVKVERPGPSPASRDRGADSIQ
jgi:formate dehydrogenase major subunit